MPSRTRIKIYLKAGVSTDRVAAAVKQISNTGAQIDNTFETIGMITCRATEEELEAIKLLQPVENTEEDED